MTENIFEKGVLISLKISMFGSEIQLKKPIKIDDSDPSWLKGKKRIINKKYSKEIEKVRTTARNYLYSLALPFPTRGLFFVPADLISAVDSQLKIYQIQFNKKLQEFIQKLDEIKIEAQEKLGQNYNENDYLKNMKEQCDFSWQFFSTSPPDGSTLKNINPDLYERERQKFLEQMTEARQMAILALRNEFINMVKHLVEKLSNPKNRFKYNTIRNFEKFFKAFEARNCFNDKELEKIIKQSKGLLNGVSAKDLRTDLDMREEISTEFAKIHDKIEKEKLTVRYRALNIRK